jgi:protein-disulfide isomerase
MKQKHAFLPLLIVLAVALPAFSGIFSSQPSEKEIEKAITANPDLILNVLRAHKDELYKIVSEAFQEEQAKHQKDEAAKEEKEFNEAFLHPLQPVIDKNTLIDGNKNAKYTLVEYSDFQCPFCGRGFLTVEELQKKYGPQMRFIYKNMPLPMHPQSMPAAEYFEAVALQSRAKAWLFNSKMFRNQSRLGPEFYKQTIKELGLDVKRAEKDAKSKRVQDLIQADIKEATKFGFTGTPGFLLNGIPVRGAYPAEKFVSIINRLKGGTAASTQAPNKKSKKG